MKLPSKERFLRSSKIQFQLYIRLHLHTAYFMQQNPRKLILINYPTMEFDHHKINCPMKISTVLNQAALIMADVLVSSTGLPKGANRNIAQKARPT